AWRAASTCCGSCRHNRGCRRERGDEVLLSLSAGQTPPGLFARAQRAPPRRVSGVSDRRQPAAAGGPAGAQRDQTPRRAGSCRSAARPRRPPRQARRAEGLHRSAVLALYRLPGRDGARGIRAADTGRSAVMNRRGFLQAVLAWATGGAALVKLATAEERG